MQALSYQGIGISSDPLVKRDPVSLDLLRWIEHGSRFSEIHQLWLVDTPQILNYQAIHGMKESEARRIILEKGHAKAKDLELIIKAHKLKNVKVLRHNSMFGKEQKKGFYRKTNNAGGFEGGVSNGENIVLRAATKPYATLMSPLQSVNIASKKKEAATVERSDVTAVPACGVVGEAMVAFELANAFLEKFGGDSLKETLRNYHWYLKQIQEF